MVESTSLLCEKTSSISESQKYLNEKSKDYGMVVDEYPDSDKTCVEGKRCGCIPQWFAMELKYFFKLSWPMALTAIAQFLVMPVSVAFCGHLGTTVLAGVSMANTVINVTGIAIGTGFVTACDTLFSQTYGSSANKKNLGILVQRSLYILILTCLPCWAIHLNTETLLHLLGQDDAVCEITARYILFFMPGLLFNFIFQVMMKYMQNQGIVYPLIVIGLIGNIVNAVCHYVFLFQLNLGPDGSAISQVLAHLTFMILAIMYILIAKVYKETWSGWSREAFQEWGIFIRYAIPGTLMLCLDFFSAEIGMFLAGTLSEIDLSAMSIIHQITAASYQISMGISYAASIRVGTALGSSNSIAASRTSKVSIIIVAASGTCVGSIFIVFNRYLPAVFSNDISVIDITSQILPIVAIYQVTDGIASVCGGVLRGCGQQHLGSLTIFIGFYIVAIPIGVPLMFATELKTSGFWWGMAIGVTVNMVLLLIIIYKRNWDKEVADAQMRVGEDNSAALEDDLEASLKEKRPLLQGNNCAHNIYNAMDGDTPTYKLQSGHVEKDKSSSWRQVYFLRTLCLLIVLLCLLIGAYASAVVAFPSARHCPNVTVIESGRYGLNITNSNQTSFIPGCV